MLPALMEQAMILAPMSLEQALQRQWGVVPDLVLAQERLTLLLLQFHKVS